MRSNSLKMQIKELSYQTNSKSEAIKEFALAKNQLKEQRFAQDQVKKVIRDFLSERSLEKLVSQVDQKTILLSTPTRAGAAYVNTIPMEYAHFLAMKFGTDHINLQDYLLCDQDFSSQSAYNIANSVKNNFSFNFKNEMKFFEFKELTKGKNLILVDDVLSTGETAAHLATYLQYKAQADIGHIHAMVAVNQHHPSDRDVQRFSKKLHEHLGNEYSEKTLLSESFKHFSPYTRMKLTRFERGIHDIATSSRVLNLMKINNHNIQKNLEGSLQTEIPVNKHWKIDKDPDLEI